jgi:hypothetical protein
MADPDRCIDEDHVARLRRRGGVYGPGHSLRPQAELHFVQ